MAKDPTLRYVLSFKNVLRKNKKKYAFLQLTGKNEDYLVKELMFMIYRKSNGWMTLSNLGNKSELKHDIGILNGNVNKESVVGLIEAKYLRNRHRYWEAKATDESRGALKDLGRQLKKKTRQTHGGRRLRLRSLNKAVYGLVFASYISEKKDDAKDGFLKKQLKIATEYKLVSCGADKPQLKVVYEDEKVRLFGKKDFYVTLWMGMWRRSDV